jgi:regulator of protease activity HflC (stomatin/prohibitin superfamily)
MAASSSDYRPLLRGGHWLAGSAAVLAILYGAAGDSYIALALGLQYLLIAAAIGAVRGVQQQRDLAAETIKASPMEATADSQSAGVSADPLRAAVQTHAMIMGGSAAVVAMIAAVQLLQQAGSTKVVEHAGPVFGMLCLAAAFVWLVLSRSFHSIDKADLPEVRPLVFAFREAQWGSLLAAAGLIGSTFDLLPALWAGRILLVWDLAISAETLLRLAAAMVVAAEPGKAPIAPIQLLLREVLCTAANPVGSMVRVFEERCGVSVRSSWAISFLKRSALPLLAFLLLLSWGLTSLAIVEPHQMAVREQFGRTIEEPLSPGLHITLPWPFGRIRAFPVKTVRELPIGYVEEDSTANKTQPRALLWTKPHAKEEFALVLGGGSELLAVNALVYFKISEEPQGFRDFVYQQSMPEAALTAFTYRSLMEETRGRTLDEVLSADRADFARRLVNSVRDQARTARLGLEVVDLALLNLHPPIEAGGSYLEVISARLDAGRRVTEAEGDRQVALLDAQMRSAMSVASAEIDRSLRVGGAIGDVAEFTAIGQALSASPRTLRLRLWIEALESALSDQRLFLVDHTLLDEGGELLLDTRRLEGTRLPPLDETMSPSSLRTNPNDR